MSLHVALCVKGNWFSRSIVVAVYRISEGSLRTTVDTVDFNACVNGICFKKSILQKVGNVV